MNNSIQLGLLSILLSLVGIFFYFNYSHQTTGYSIDVIEKCPGICCKRGCEDHLISINKDGTLIYSGQNTTVEKFAQHIQSAHPDCDVLFVGLFADKEVDHQIVFNITDTIKSASSKIRVAWD